MEGAPLKDSWNAPQSGGGLFKEVNNLRNQKPKGDDDEADKWADSFFGRLAANKKFEGLTFFFIGFNSLYIGYDADYSSTTGKPDALYAADMPIGFKIMENIFCVYFTGEVVVRLIGFKSKKSCFTDKWFVFDSILVIMMLLETWIFPIFGLSGSLNQLSVLRLLRLLRISRMARLMKKVPELMIIIKGLIASCRSVGCTAILQVLIIYVWSILFVSTYHELTDDDEEEIASFFGSMGKSAFTLFIMGTVLDDVTAATNAIRVTDNTFMLALFIIFILISSFTILNMLIGILCEVVSATAESEKAKAAEMSVKDAITNLFTTLDKDGSGTITENEFMSMRDDDQVLEALEEMDIYESQFFKFGNLLFARDDTTGLKPTITFEKLITLLMRLSPGNHINALDFSLLQASIDKTQEGLRDRILKIHEMLAVQCLGGVALTPGPDYEVLRQTSLPSNDGFHVEDEVEAVVPPPPKAPIQYTLDMFSTTSSHEIIEELEWRLGVTGTEASCFVAPAAPAPQNVVLGKAVVFNPLGVPEETDPSEMWS